MQTHVDVHRHGALVFAAGGSDSRIHHGNDRNIDFAGNTEKQAEICRLHVWRHCHHEPIGTLRTLLPHLLELPAARSAASGA